MEYNRARGCVMRSLGEILYDDDTIRSQSSEKS
jgi:hypothetical protein